jgi:tRNA threonylcarbamoyladenosine biosynthesis protein TsaB
VLLEEQLAPDGGRPLHAQALLPALERAADAAGGWAEVELLAAGTGPGSFTGLRIGLATARALAGAAGIGSAGVGTLDALAAGIPEGTGEDGRLAVIDARRGEVFAALYDGGGGRIWGPAVLSPGQLAERVRDEDRSPLGAGSGALRFRQELAESGVRIPPDSDPVHRVAARHICALGAGAEVHAGLEPIYLRPPDAERWRDRDRIRPDRS